MGWCGDIRYKLEDAQERIDTSIKYSLSWLRAVDDWNDVIYELGIEYLKDFTDLKFPTNCDIPEDWADPKYGADALPIIDYPEFDPNQILRKLN